MHHVLYWEENTQEDISCCETKNNIFAIGRKNFLKLHIISWSIGKFVWVFNISRFCKLMIWLEKFYCYKNEIILRIRKSIIRHELMHFISVFITKMHWTVIYPSFMTCKIMYLPFCIYICIFSSRCWPSVALFLV